MNKSLQQILGDNYVNELKELNKNYKETNKNVWKTNKNRDNRIYMQSYNVIHLLKLREAYDIYKNQNNTKRKNRTKMKTEKELNKINNKLKVLNDEGYKTDYTIDEILKDEQNEKIKKFL